jgi:hypothetical protein
MQSPTVLVKVVTGVGTIFHRFLRDRRTAKSSATTIVNAQSEANYSIFLVQTHQRSRQTRFVVTAVMAGGYILRSSCNTWQAAVVLVLAKCTMMSCIGYVTLQKFNLSVTHHLRVRVETMLSVALILSMVLLPPLSLSNLRVSDNTTAGALVRNLSHASGQT